MSCYLKSGTQPHLYPICLKLLQTQELVLSVTRPALPNKQTLGDSPIIFSLPQLFKIRNLSLGLGHYCCLETACPLTRWVQQINSSSHVLMFSVLSIHNAGQSICKAYSGHGICDLCCSSDFKGDN